MTQDVRGETEPGFASLAGGIISDVQHLIAQQFTLLRSEIEGEIRQAKNAAISLAVGAGITSVGGLLLLLMAVHLLKSYTEMPLWGCYGLVGGLLVGTGVLFLFRGGREAADLHR